MRSTTTQPSLEWLINPITKAEFFQNYWEKQTLVVKRDQPGYFSSLLTFDDIDRVITTLDRRYPNICLKNANDPQMTSADYTLAGGALDVAKVYQLFEKGSTITLSFLDSVLPALNIFCRTLEAEFNHPFQTNIYMTPPRAQGAQPHYDTHDVFVLQVAGSKRWTIFGTPLELPLQSQEFDAGVQELGPPTLEFELTAGDLAYIPRGATHEARSTDTVSLHITTGILRYTWAEFLLEFMARASANNSAFRKSLPPGFAHSDFDRTQARETLRSLIQQAATAADFDSVLDHFIDRFIAACPPVLEGQMGQLGASDTLTPESLAGARPGVFSRVEASGSSLVLDTYGRRITLPSHVAAAVKFALSSPRFAIRDLPGELDDPGKLTLIRRLIREGLVMAL